MKLETFQMNFFRKKVNGNTSGASTDVNDEESVVDLKNIPNGGSNQKKDLGTRLRNFCLRKKKKKKEKLVNGELVSTEIDTRPSSGNGSVAFDANSSVSLSLVKSTVNSGSTVISSAACPVKSVATSENDMETKFINSAENRTKRFSIISSVYSSANSTEISTVLSTENSTENSVVNIAASSSVVDFNFADDATGSISENKRDPESRWKMFSAAGHTC